MSILLKRALVLIATLTLAGIAVGCDKQDSTLGESSGLESSENLDQQQDWEQNQVEEQAANMGQQDPSQTDEPAQAGEAQDDPSQMAQGESASAEAAAEEQAATQEQDEMASAESAEQQVEDTEIVATREKVADELDIPVDAVIIASVDQQKLMQASDEFEREARVTASTVEGYLDQVDVTALDDEQQAAYQELQTSITTLSEDIEQFAALGEDQREDIKSQVEEHLSAIDDNWDTISERIDFSQSAIGGGPVEEGENLDEPPASDETETY